MLVVWCAWCGCYLGEKDGKGVEGDTHGICKKCQNAILEKWLKREKNEAGRLPEMQEKFRHSRRH